MPDLEEVGLWKRLAKMDYDIAVHDLTFNPTPVEIICYHCQQAAEKAVKAWFVYNDEEFPYIHDLSVLLKICPSIPDIGQDADAMKQPAERLSKMATATRYPSKIEFDESNMNLALKDAKLIVETMFAAIDRRIEKEEKKTNETNEKPKQSIAENLDAMKKIIEEKADEPKNHEQPGHDSR